MAHVQEFTKPDYKIDLSNAQIISKPIPPLQLLKVIDGGTFEEMVHEWVYGYLKLKYEKVCHIGGTGDKGRDVVAYSDYKKDVWDNYQCKHYAQKLSTSEVILEIGKLCYYCYMKEFAPPKKYFFVSQSGVVAKVHDLLKNGVSLRDTLKNKWNRICKSKICFGKKIDLEGSFCGYIDSFDFSMFDYIEPLVFIKQYKETCYYSSRFGGISKPRPLPKSPPQKIQESESVYIKKILGAYSEYLKDDINNSKKLDNYPDIKTDFERHRTCFFCAESLKGFSRDIYDPDLNYFEKLKNEIYDGIIDTVEEDADNGFDRLKKVLRRATEIVITNNPLINSAGINDKKGICHHLSNERSDIKWKK